MRRHFESRHLPILPVPIGVLRAEETLRLQSVRSSKTCGLSFAWSWRLLDASRPCWSRVDSTRFSVSLGLIRTDESRFLEGGRVRIRSAHVVLVNLIQHRTIAYSQQPGRCFPIPAGFLESHGDCISLGFPLDALDQRFQRFRD